MARNALLAFAILLAGVVGPFLMPSGASADGGLLDGAEEGVTELTDTLDQPEETDAEAPVDKTSGAAEVQKTAEATEPVSEGISGTSELVVQSVSEAAQPLSESVSKASESVVESVSPVLEPVVEAAEPLLQTGVDIAAPVIDPLVATFAPVLHPIVELSEPLLEPVLEITELALDPVLELTEPGLPPLVEPIEPLDPLPKLIEPVAPAPIVELTDPVLDSPSTKEEAGGSLLPVVPVSSPGLFELLDPAVEARQPLLQKEPTTEGSRKGSGIHALKPNVAVALTGSNPFITLGNDHSSYPLQAEFRPGAGSESARIPVSSSVLLSFDGERLSPAGSGNRLDWPDSGLATLSAALLAIGVLLLSATTEASPRTWQFRLVTPPA